MSWHFADAVLSDDTGPAPYTADPGSTGYTPVDFTGSAGWNGQVYPTPDGLPPPQPADDGSFFSPPPPPPSSQADVGTPSMSAQGLGSTAAGFLTGAANLFTSFTSAFMPKPAAPQQQMQAGPPTWLIVAGVGVAALGAFAVISSRRGARVGRYHRRKR